LLSLKRWGEVILTHATRMDLRKIMLREIISHREDKHCMTPLTCCPQIVRATETESRMMVASG
jgi:hypothetical protein